jgi:hypothetical protein
VPTTRYRRSGGTWYPWKFVTPNSRPILAGREGLVAGVHEPTALTVGAVTPALGWVEVGTGVQMALTPGTYENRVFLGSVNHNVGSGVYVFKNCWFAGNDPNGADSGGSVIKNAGSSTPRPSVTLIDCTIDPSYWITVKGRTRLWPEINGVFGGNFVVRRCEITNVCDGVGINGYTYGFTLELSWLHKGTYATGAENTGQSDLKVHSDAIQFHTGKKIRIKGNVIGGVRNMVGYQMPFADCYNSGDDFENSCFMIKQEVGSEPNMLIEDVIIEENWVQGGVASFNFTYNADKPNRFGSTIIRNNRLRRREAGWAITRKADGTLKPSDPSTNNGLGWYFLKSGNLDATIAGNVFEDTGLPIPISG